MRTGFQNKPEGFRQDLCGIGGIGHRKRGHVGARLSVQDPIDDLRPGDVRHINECRTENSFHLNRGAQGDAQRDGMTGIDTIRQPVVENIADGV